MNVRLSDSEKALVRVIQAYFGKLVPVPLELSHSEVVRLSLRNLTERLAADDKHVAEEVAAIRRGKNSDSTVHDELPRPLIGDDRKRKYNGFFRELISKLKERGFDKQRKAPSTSWYSFPAGHGMRSWAQYSCSFNRDAKARVELYLDSDTISNKALFDYLYVDRKAIEAEFGEALDWQRLDNNKASRVAVSPRDASIEDDDATLEDIQDWMAEKLWSLDRALGPKLEGYLL